MRLKSIFLIVFSCLFSSLLKAQESSPKLIVVLTLNQYYPEWTDYYKENLKYGGFKKLLARSEKREADYNSYFSQLAVDHATLLTGSYPSRHGLPFIAGYDNLEKKGRNFARDDKQMAMAGMRKVACGNLDALNMLTLGTLMRVSDSFSKSFSIGINMEEACVSAGGASNGAFWIDQATGKWCEHPLQITPTETWLTRCNIHYNQDSIIRKGWMPLESEMNRNASTRIVNKMLKSDYFYYDLEKAYHDYQTCRVLKATPIVNRLAVDLACDVIKENALGKDNDPDLLTLSFTAFDYMNRDYPIFSAEAKDLVVRTDRDLNTLIDFLDREVGQSNYLFVLTYSQARELLPVDLKSYNIASETFSMYKAVALLRSYLNLLYGNGEWIKYYDAAQLYLNRDLLLKKQIDLSEMQRKVADFLGEFKGVEAVFSANELLNGAAQDQLTVKMRNSYNRKKSGDVLVAILPYWTYENNTLIEHKQEYSRRSKVPFYVYGNGAHSFNVKRFNMVDVMPTLCDILNIPVPSAVNGTSLIR